MKKFVNKYLSIAVASSMIFSSGCTTLNINHTPQHKKNISSDLGTKTLLVKKEWNKKYNDIYWVLPGFSQVANRDSPIYTPMLWSCSGLVIDSPKINKHFLYHVSDLTKEDRIIAKIRKNFPKLDDVRVYIKPGALNLKKSKNIILNSLEKLGIEDRVTYLKYDCNNFKCLDSLLIKNGQFFLTEKDNENYLPDLMASY